MIRCSPVVAEGPQTFCFWFFSSCALPLSFFPFFLEQSSRQTFKHGMTIHLPSAGGSWKNTKKGANSPPPSFLLLALAGSRNFFFVLLRLLLSVHFFLDLARRRVAKESGSFCSHFSSVLLISQESGENWHNGGTSSTKSQSLGAAGKKALERPVPLLPKTVKRGNSIFSEFGSILLLLLLAAAGSHRSSSCCSPWQHFERVCITIYFQPPSPASLCAFPSSFLRVFFCCSGRTQ